MRSFVSLLLVVFSVASGCASDPDANANDDRDIDLKAKAATTLHIHLDAPTQLSLISDQALNVRIKVTQAGTQNAPHESEWSSTPFVDVGESGEFEVELLNDSSEALIGKLLSTPI